MTFGLMVCVVATTQLRHHLRGHHREVGGIPHGDTVAATAPNEPGVAASGECTDASKELAIFLGDGGMSADHQSVLRHLIARCGVRWCVGVLT